MNRMRTRKPFGFLVILVTLISMLSCVAAIPVAIKYYKDAKQTRAKAEMPAPAEKVYRTAVSMAEEKNLKILKKEDDKLYLEVTDGIQTGSLKAVATASDKTEVTITATAPSEEPKEKKKEHEKELTLRAIDRICERLEVKCTIEKQ